MLVFNEERDMRPTLLRLFRHVFFRANITGHEHLPARGGALVVANLVSIVDAFLVSLFLKREVTYVVRSDIASSGWAEGFARRLRVVAVSPSATSAELEVVVETLRSRIADGEVVCVTGQRQLSESGTALPWHADYGCLTKGLDAPIIPLYLHRLWHNFYVIDEGELEWVGKKFRRPLLISLGVPREGETAGIAVRGQIKELGQAVYAGGVWKDRLLHHGFVRAARKHPGRRAVADALVGELSYFKALVGSIVFARKLRAACDEQPMVGILLPSSVGSALTNIAVSFMGKVPVNLNYSANSEIIAACAAQCNITHVVTSRKFLEKVPLRVPGTSIYLEDVKASVSSLDRIVAMLYAVLAPMRVIEKSLGAGPRTEDDIATVIFSSGSEGTPKGVLLTHRNLMANIVSILQVCPRNDQTCFVGFLPLFHSFGYTGTLWMPLTSGLSVFYHPNPLESKVIGGLIKKYQGTFMFATSTFLQGFIRRCTPEQLATLEFVACGAEKLSPRISAAFKEKFGVEPCEGYGTTECAPVVSCNVPDLVSPGFYTRESKVGAVGLPMPGVCARVVDPDTEEPLPQGESGLLLVTGENIMRGYLDQPEKTASVLKDRWYATGDIATVDDEGFIRITDRLARFSKIAGEMVPHTGVEEKLHALLGLTDQSMAVAGVPDQAKGERLLVLHTLSDEQVETLLVKLRDSGMPNLWIPRASAFHRIEEIPVLGTGKMDLKSVKKMAAALDAAK